MNRKKDALTKIARSQIFLDVCPRIFQQAGKILEQNAKKASAGTEVKYKSKN